MNIGLCLILVETKNCLIFSILSPQQMKGQCTEIWSWSSKLFLHNIHQLDEREMHTRRRMSADCIRSVHCTQLWKHWSWEEIILCVDINWQYLNCTSNCTIEKACILWLQITCKSISEEHNQFSHKHKIFCPSKYQSSRETWGENCKPWGDCNRKD